MNLSNDGMIERANAIVSELGFTSLTAYAAEQPIWENAIRDHSRGGTYVAKAEKITSDQEIVLGALKLQGWIKPLDGYYEECYVPEIPLEEAIDRYQLHQREKHKATRINQAEAMAEDDGFSSAFEYAVCSIDWEKIDNDPRTNGGHYIIRPEGLTQPQKFILDALKLKQVIMQVGGYYSECYIPGKGLEQAIDQVARSQLRIRQEEIVQRAKDASVDAGYSRLTDYAAAEIEWELTRGSTSGKFFVRDDDALSETQRLVLEALAIQKRIDRPTSGTHAHDFVAGTILSAMIEQMNRFAQWAQSAPPGKGHR